MMKAFYYLCLFAGLTFGTLTFTACGAEWILRHWSVMIGVPSTVKTGM